MDNKTHITDKDYNDLHNKLAQTVLDFFKEKGLPENAWMLTFSFDDLKSSTEHGSWHPASDSSMELWDDHKNCLFYEI